MSIDLASIEYQDWYQHRDPCVGDIAKVIDVYKGEAVKVKLACEASKEKKGWLVLLPVSSLQYKLVS